MHKKVLSMMLYVDEHGREQKRTALEWVSFVKNIIHVKPSAETKLSNGRIKSKS